MMSMHELIDLRMQQQLAHELYRQQIMQRIPDPFPSMLPMHALPQPQMMIPPRPSLPGVDVKLENNDLWQQFHKIGTEMIITKSGRRMFPSMRISLSGLDEESSYCVLLEMVPIGDCRFKFSGSQWVPAGGAEPQSPQRMYLHPDSPATGSHWQSQALLFNKVKLTNNTLDNNGHIVLASMHKYQPRLHIIRTSDLTQLPWAPQQAFVFPETEFVAVTAYQNDRITKLKIDNNPFAKGFRESGQSRCKRKLNHNEMDSGVESSSNNNNSYSHISEDDRSSVSSFDSPQSKRLRTTYEDEVCSTGSLSPHFNETSLYTSSPVAAHAFRYLHHQHHPAILHAHSIDFAAAAAYFGQQTAPHLTLPVPMVPHMPAQLLHVAQPESLMSASSSSSQHISSLSSAPSPSPTATATITTTTKSKTSLTTSAETIASPPPKRSNNFSISAILAY